MSMKKTGALRSEELMKLSHDPSDPNEDIWQLSLQIRALWEQLDEYETGLHRVIDEQMCILEGLLNWCDSLLYQSCALYCKREKNDSPEG